MTPDTVSRDSTDLLSVTRCLNNPIAELSRLAVATAFRDGERERVSVIAMTLDFAIDGTGHDTLSLSLMGKGELCIKFWGREQVIQLRDMLDDYLTKRSDLEADPEFRKFLS